MKINEQTEKKAFIGSCAFGDGDGAGACSVSNVSPLIFAFSKV